MKYKFVGVEFWGGKTLSEFKECFGKQIPPKEMKGAFEEIQKEYKAKYSEKKVKPDKIKKINKATGDDLELKASNANKE